MFGFPQKEHKSFSKNFLKTVIFQISFDENELIVKKKDDIIDLFKSIFPRINKNVTKGFQIQINPNEPSPKLQQLNNDTGLEMKSEDGQKIILINPHSLSYTISGKAYKNYSSLKEDITQLKSFFELCKIEKIKRLAIRKINIVEFKLSENPSEILELLITPELLSNLNYFPNANQIKQNIQSIVYRDGSYNLNLKYGLNVPPPPNTEIGQIIIDIDLFNNSVINISEVDDISNEINSEIFNIFIWAISENTLNLLNE